MLGTDKVMHDIKMELSMGAVTWKQTSEGREGGGNVRDYLGHVMEAAVTVVFSAVPQQTGG